MDEGVLKDLQNYRSDLIDSWKVMSDAYDKIIITLSGGALGLSFFFISDVITKKVSHAGWLVGAWAMWTLSLIAIGTAFLASRRSLETAMEQVDLAIEKDDSSLVPVKPGGQFTALTRTLDYLAGLFFVLGVLSISIFVLLNMR